MLNDESQKELENVYSMYSEHPEFLGIDIDSPNCKGALGNTLLHLACFRGDHKSGEILIRNGADVNARGDLDNTPLHDAALGDNRKCVELLIENGARVELTNEFGQTPKRVAELGDKRNAITVL